MLKFAIAITLMSSTAALASCPTNSDLETGILLENSNGVSEWHANGDNSSRQVFYLHDRDGGKGSVVSYAHGIYWTAMTPVENLSKNSNERVDDYPLSAAMSWPSPKPNTDWKIAEYGGAAITSSTVEKVLIGECEYDGYELVVEFTDRGEKETYTIIESLDNLAVLTSTTDSDGKIEPYEYVAMKADPIPELATDE